ncbi:MAG: hypothetical protein RR603_04465 [Kurthia sp.]
MTDRELLEQILTKVNKIDSIEQTVNHLSTKVDGLEQSFENLSTRMDRLEQSFIEMRVEMNVKIDAITNQVVQLSEDITIVKEQTAMNAELRSDVNVAVSRIDAIEMDLKIMKKVISS